MRKTLSLVISAHREGRIAHKTMRSALRALEKLKHASIPYEVIITLDNPDEETINYFSTYKNTSYIRIEHVDFKDLSKSRNYGISLAKGDFVATLDADDLVSENWFMNGLKLLESTKGKCVVHTKYSINFGNKDIVWEKFDSKSKEEDALIMTWANRWDSAVIAHKDIFIKFPYLPNTDGYGSEDWHFNSETLAADIPHKVAPESILFVRRKDVSLMTEQAASRKTVRYTNLLSLEFLKNINTQLYVEQKNTTKNATIQKTLRNELKKYALIAHRKAKKLIAYRIITDPVVKKIILHKDKEMSTTSSNRFPQWLINEWFAIHQIEKEIFPSKELIDSIEIYHSEMYDLGLLFVDLAKQISKKPDYTFFIPTLTKGGAEHVMLRYVETILELHPDWHIAVVATDAGSHPWRSRLLKSVDFIQFGDITNGLAESLRTILMERFLVQIQSERIHLAQSIFMFDFVKTHRELFRNKKVYAFAFCEDFDNQGRISGHIHSGIPYTYDTVDSIFTDNRTLVDDVVKEYAFDESKFKVHYQPTDIKIRPPRRIAAKDRSLKILWASRIAKQKRPDILIDIAKKLNYRDYQIDVYGAFQDNYSESDFDSINTLNYRGGFNGINEIPLSDYDLFLYTSENDGVPNILLEVSAAGLPIIASNAGGIKEFIIDGQSGMLVFDKEDIDSYILKIESVKKQEIDTVKLVEEAQRLLASQHSKTTFKNSLKKDLR